jgi:cation transport protein ChaC
LNYLNNREVTLGGYVSHITMFYPRDSSLDPFPILLYIATPTSQHWLGPAPLDEVAEQVSHLAIVTGTCTAF